MMHYSSINGFSQFWIYLLIPIIPFIYACVEVVIYFYVNLLTINIPPICHIYGSYIGNQEAF